MTFGQLLVTHCHCEEDDHSADFLLTLFTMQSMMVPQLKVDKQQLDDTETVTGAKVPRSVCGKCVLIYSWMLLTSDDSLMVSSATAPPMNDHVDEPTLLLLAATMMP